MKKIIILFIFLLTINSVSAEKQLPDLILALGDGGPASDVILLTQINQYLTEAGYENMPQGITKLFSEIKDLDEKVTIVAYKGEVEAIVGANSPSSYDDFAEDLKNILDKENIPVKISKSEDLETQNLMDLYDIQPEKQEIIPIIQQQPEVIEPNITNAEENKTEPIQEPIIIQEQSIFQKIISWFKSFFN